MSKILENTKRLVTTPGMFNAYCNWLIARRLSNHGPALSCTPDSKITGWLNFSEYWSFHHGVPEAEKLLMQKCLNRGNQEKTVAIDIGANLGLFSVVLASIGYDQIHAFEPVPQTFARLKSNVVNNQFLEKVKLNCTAIGSEEGFIEFQIFDNSPAINRIVKSNQQQEKTTRIQKVTVTTLDQYCAEHDINKIDFLKIDVEGMEPLVIQGSENILKNKRVSTILLEICPANLKISGSSISELYESILKLGYLPHLLLTNGDIGKVLKLEHLQTMTLANVVVIPAV